MKNILLFQLFLIFTFFNYSSQMNVFEKKLPVTEYGNTEKGESKLVIYISGDGGINTFSESLCRELVKTGYSVVALDSKKYFWTEKTPEQFATDVEYLAKYYMSLWGSNSFILVGYSFGADVSAFIPRRIQTGILAKMETVILLVPYASTDFEIKLMDMLGNNSVMRKYNITDELNAIHDHQILCLFPEDEEDSIKDNLHNKNIKIKVLPGKHRFDNDYSGVVDAIVEGIDR